MAKLTLDRGGARESFPLGEEAVTIGRSPGNTIVIEDTASSRRHCRIDPVSGGFELLDLESQNGTRVNGKTVKRHLLQPGDKIEIGTHAFTFDAGDDGVEIEEVRLEGETEATTFLVFEGGPHDAERIDLAPGTQTIGRKKTPGVDLAIDDASVSSKHAEIRMVESDDATSATVTVKDLGSTNGTFKNGARISEAELRHGDQLRFGSVKMRFSDARAGSDLPEVSVLAADSGRGKRSMLPSVALLALLLVAGGAAAFFALRPDRTGVKPAGPPPAGSLVREGWSFEEAEAADLWKAEVGVAAPAEGSAKSGSFALRLTPAVAEDAWGLGVASWDRDVPIRSGAAYRVAAAVAGTGGPGAGGVELRYYDRTGPHPDVPVWTAGSEMVRLGSSFRDVDAVVSAPASMNVTHARVACVAFGSQMRALFDDVVLVPAEGDAAAMRGASFTVQSFTVDVGRGGSVWLRRGNAEWLDGFQLVGAKAGIGRMSAPLLARDTSVAKVADGIRCEAAVGLPGAESTGPKAVFEVSAPADGAAIHVRLQGPSAQAAGLDSIGFEGSLGEALAAQPIVLVTAEAARTVNGDVDATEATNVVLGSGAERIRIRSAAPFRVAVTTSAGAPRLRFEPPSGGPLDLDLEIQISFTAERSEAEKLRIEAEQAEKDGRIGDAIARYRSILKDFPFNEKVTDVAQARVTELESRVERDVASLGFALAEAQFFSMAPLLAKVKADAESKTRVYSGTKGAAEATEIAGKAASALEAIEKTNAEATAEQELERGRDLVASGSKTLGTLVLKSVVERYAGTKAADQAKAALEGR
jgi:pSer/pThr/pTyr-binding forkhead associated (FHA) protein